MPLLPRILIRLGRKEHHLHGVAQEQLSKLSNLISQTLATVRLQRATQTDALWRRQMTASAEDYAAKNFEVVRTGWHIFPIGACPTLIAYAVLLVIGIDKNSGRGADGRRVCCLTVLCSIVAGSVV